MRPSRVGGLLLVPGGALFLAFLLAPMLALLEESFRLFVPGRVGSAAGAPLTLANYGELLDGSFVRFLVETFRISLLTTAIGLVVAYPIAYQIARRFRPMTRGLAIGFLVTLLFLSAVVRTYALELTFGSVGPLSPFLVQLGVSPNSRGYIEVLVGAGLLQYIIPMSALILVGTLQNLDPRLVDAAQALGAPAWKAHATITLPLSVQGLLSAFLVSFAFSISAFVNPMILGKGRVLFLSNLIYGRFSEIANYPSGAAIAMVTLVVSLAAVYLISRLVSVAARAGPPAEAGAPRQAAR